MRYELNRIPSIAKARRNLADTYRHARKVDAASARLLYQRMKEIDNKLGVIMIGGTNVVQIGDWRKQQEEDYSNEPGEF